MINILSQLILIWNLCGKKTKILIILSPVLSILAAFCEAQNILLLKPIVVILIGENSKENINLYPIFLFLFISILTSVLKSSSQFLNISITAKIGADLPVLIFRKLLNLPYSILILLMLRSQILLEV